MRAFIQTIKGLLLSLLIFAVPTLLLIAIAPKGRISAGDGIAIAMAVPFILFFVMAFVLIVQATVSSKMKRSSGWTVLGIWLIYPIAFSSYAVSSMYTSYRINLAKQHDYSSRTIDGPPADEVRSILLVETGRSDFLSYRDGDCRGVCVEALRTGVLDALIRPAPFPSLGYRVYRHARGRLCQEAQSNYWQHNELLNENRRILDDLIFRVREKRLEPEDKKRVDPAFAASLKRPRSVVRSLSSQGHFDQCITVHQEENSAHDVRIDIGRDFVRPYGPCCRAADIYVNRKGDDVLIARWEIGDRNHFKGRGAWFELHDIISELKGQMVTNEVTPYPVTGIENEIKRISDLLDRNAYYYSLGSVAEWLTNTIREELKREKLETIELSVSGIDNIKNILRRGSQKARTDFLSQVGEMIEPTGLDRLADFVNRPDDKCPVGYDNVWQRHQGKTMCLRNRTVMTRAKCGIHGITDVGEYCVMEDKGNWWSVRVLR